MGSGVLSERSQHIHISSCVTWYQRSCHLHPNGLCFISSSLPATVKVPPVLAPLWALPPSRLGEFLHTHLNCETPWKPAGTEHSCGLGLERERRQQKASVQHRETFCLLPLCRSFQQISGL